MDIPPRFDDAFISWFRMRTEETWANDYPERRWLPGLTDEEIVTVEQTWNVRFPTDYRLFLQRLHAIGEAPPGAGRSRKRLVPIRKSKLVYNWFLDAKELRTAFAWPFNGLTFDVEHNSLWRPSWGERPTTPEARRERLGQLVASAPRLIPITGYRYLLGEPCQAGNPILSVYQSDIIIYGADLRRFLLIEFAHLLGVASLSIGQQSREARPKLEDIPFWGEIVQA